MATTRDVYSSLIEMSREAFTARHYETAYHALMAALHAATDQQDVQRLEAVASLAQQQQQELDRLSPSHTLATDRTTRRAQPGSFGKAARQATAQARLLRGRSDSHEGTGENTRKADAPRRVPRPGQDASPVRLRQARLRPEASHLYPGIDVAAWLPAATMAEMVWSHRLRLGRPSPAGRVLSPEHFQFRYGGADRRRRADAGRRMTDVHDAHE
jgi:hypothetical protein